jgi:prolyl oligopeptidase
MRNGIIPGVVAAMLATAASAGERVTPVGVPPPPAAAVKPVTEDYFGTSVTDNYRYMEAMDADTQAWMLAQGARTRGVFDSIPARKAYGETLAAFSGGFGFTNGYVEAGDRAFYAGRAPGLDAYDLIVRDKGGAPRKLIDVNGLIRAKGEPHAINYFSPSHDGTKVAVGMSTGGSENASLYVYDAATGALLAGPVGRAQFGGANWTDDGKGLFFLRLREMTPGVPITEKYNDSAAVFWNLKDEPVPLAGASVGRGPKIDTIGFPVVATHPAVKRDALIVGNGVENEVGLFVAAKGSAAGSATWRPIFDRTAGVTGLAMRGSDLWVLSHDGAPTFKILQTTLDATDLTSARVAVPSRPGRVISTIGAASDGLYFIAREGLYAKLYRLEADGSEKEIALPAKGTVDGLAAEPDKPGVTVFLDGWTTPPTTYRYTPAAGFTDLKLERRPASYDPASLTSAELLAKAKDGVEVPLSVIAPAGPRKPRPVLMEAYGSYGVPILPGFTPREAAFVQAGGVSAVCHVRGGGELGDQWRLDGKGAKKPNTWNDFIACAETLIAGGWTTADMLTIRGTSAGGIAVGMAATQRPDLFAGAVWGVPMASALRAEFQQNGPANIPEFGTVKDEQGFKDLYAMDAYQHVRDGTRYPAVLLTTGMNDPRVDPWQPGKAAARLQAAGSPNPVLLRVEAAGGHGIGSTRAQRDAEEADIHSFVFWRAGWKDWQPTAK